VIDHRTAREAFATSLDFPLDPDARDQLDAHLTACPACRSFAAAARRDAAVLRELDFGPVPVEVRANVAIAAERGRPRGTAGRVALVAVGALVLLALGGGAVLVGGGGRPPAPSVGDGNPVYWETRVVQFKAADFWVEANGQRFTATGGRTRVDSDPGNATYRTLEATWQEHGVEMRLNLYFSGDADASWVNEIRIYDGTAQPEWLTVDGRYAAVPIGGTWAGDLDIEFPAATGRLHAAGAMLRSMPFDGVSEPLGPAVNLPENAAPFAPGGPLHCSGILQLSPRDAEQALLKLGYKLSWRLVRATGPNTGYAEAMAQAPEGIIQSEGLAGSSGELIMFVAPAGDPGAKPVSYPADCPAADPNLKPTSPEP
jgi:Putative zinc-finger